MRIIISAIVIIILIFFLLLLLRSNYITETFVSVKDLPEFKNYFGDKVSAKDLEDVINYRSKVSDKYDTIDNPISDSLIPYNPEDKEWDDFIKKNRIGLAFVGDFFQIPDDPMGRKGPKLQELLSVNSSKGHNKKNVNSNKDGVIKKPTRANNATRK